jgi:hypothetical protein
MRMNLVDRIALTATLAATILILAVLGATAKAEMQPLSVVAPLAVPPTVSMSGFTTGRRVRTGSINDGRCL